MQRERILGDIKLRLEKLNIYELRQVARAVGVHRPADGKKSRVINAILEIAQNNSVPEPPSLRGATFILRLQAEFRKKNQPF